MQKWLLLFVFWEDHISLYVFFMYIMNCSNCIFFVLYFNEFSFATDFWVVLFSLAVQPRLNQSTTVL